jgi:hypothetical protein
MACLAVWKLAGCAQADSLASVSTCAARLVGEIGQKDGVPDFGASLPQIH